MGFAIADAKIADLRRIYPKNRNGMKLRADHTRSLVRQMMMGLATAPNLIDGAVLKANIGGLPAWFEADALAARFGGAIHVGEVKSFPVVDGQADPNKLSSALDQVALYILFAKQLITDLRGDPDLISEDALVITPKNIGLIPTLSLQNVTGRVARAEKLLSSVKDVREIAATALSTVNFGAAADRTRNPAARIDALRVIADTVGTAYGPKCLSTCGNAMFCRERAFVDCHPSLVGPEAVRLLPGVHSLNRVAELSDGAPASNNEAELAFQLARAGRLYDQAISATSERSTAKDVAV
jgi:hypothetical protein